MIFKTSKCSRFTHVNRHTHSADSISDGNTEYLYEVILERNAIHNNNMNNNKTTIIYTTSRTEQGHTRVPIIGFHFDLSKTQS